MNRRTFLQSAAGLALAARAAAAAAAPLSAIDTHIHLYDPTRPAGVPWPPKTDAVLYRPHLVPDFVPLATAAHVVGAVIVEASEWVEDNQWVLDLARDESVIVGVVGHLQPGRPAFASNLKRFAAQPLFRGLRLRPAYLRELDQPATRADLQRVADAGLAIDVLGGPTVLPIAARIATDFPSLPIVVDHLPFRDWDGQVATMRTALAPVVAHRNVVIKISDVVRPRDGRAITDPEHYRPALDALLDLFGPERLMYGSNWPVSNKVAPYATIHGTVAAYFANQPRAVAERYFWRTSLATYRWLPRGAAARLAG